MDLWLPPKPAIIIPAEKPKLLGPELLGITMLARTPFLRQTTAAAVSLITAIGSGTNATTAGQDTVITLPGGMAQNDIVLVATRSNTALAADAGTPSTSGYTSVSDQSSGNDRFYVARKFMSSSPDASVTINGSDFETGGQASVALVFRGVDTTTPLDVSVTTATSTSTNPDPAPITPTNNNCAIVVFAGSGVSETGVGTITNYSTPVEINADGAVNDYSAAGAYRILTGGAAAIENPAAFNSWASGLWFATTIALRPA